MSGILIQYKEICHKCLYNDNLCSYTLLPYYIVYMLLYCVALYYVTKLQLIGAVMYKVLHIQLCHVIKYYISHLLPEDGVLYCTSFFLLRCVVPHQGIKYSNICNKREYRGWLNDLKYLNGADW